MLDVASPVGITHAIGTAEVVKVIVLLYPVETPEQIELIAKL
jgi:hypothetical protein